MVPSVGVIVDNSLKKSFVTFYPIISQKPVYHYCYNLQPRKHHTGLVCFMQLLYELLLRKQQCMKYDSSKYEIVSSYLWCLYIIKNMIYCTLVCLLTCCVILMSRLCTCGQAPLPTTWRRILCLLITGCWKKILAREDLF